MTRKAAAAYARVALAGLRRHPLRGALTGAAVALAVALFVGGLGLDRGYAASLARGLDAMGYHVLVTAKGCPYETATLVLRGGSIPMYVDESLVEVLRADPAYESGTRFLMQGIEVAPGRPFMVFMGVDDEFRAHKPWMRLQQGTWFSSPGSMEALLGYNAAEVLRLRVGETLDLPVLHRNLRVAGIFERSGSQDDGMIFLPLAAAQIAFGRAGKLTGVGVRLTDLSRLGGFLDRVFETPSLQAVTLTQFRGAVLDLLGAARSLMFLSTVTGVVIAALGIFNAVLVSVTERRRELAVFKVLGASPGQVLALVCAETALLGAAGGVAGGFVAWAVGLVSDGFIMRLLPYAPPPAAGHLVAVTAWHGLAGVAGAVGVALAAGLGPAWAACRQPAAAALRESR